MEDLGPFLLSNACLYIIYASVKKALYWVELAELTGI